MQKYVEVLHSQIDRLLPYRNMGTWQHCTGSFSSISDLESGEIEWKEITSPFQCQGNQDFWFRKQYTIPESIHGIDTVGTGFKLLCFVLAPTEVYINGQKVFEERYWADFQTPEVVLSNAAVPGETYDILIHITNNSNMETLGLRLQVSLDVDKLEDLIFDMQTFAEEMKYCSGFDELKALTDQAAQYADAHMSADKNPEEIVSIIGKAREILAPAAATTKGFTVHLIGHAHIDMNWLWNMEDTIDVCKRDFSTMTQIMDEIPEFKFSQSQVSVYDITEKHFPEIFQKMKEKIAGGQWDITAATWTEGDLNMANGEAIARHILYSKEYLKEHFDKTSRVCWEPDTFGHPGNMPQILKKSGVDYYYHMRCGNGRPLYKWEGLDGSQLLAFNSPYGGPLRTNSIADISAALWKDHGLKDAMFVYGVGDHGGGPTRKDIRRAQKLNALPTMPRIIFSSTHDFFDRVQEQSPMNLPVRVGEMNPIFDGCYTSHADIKKGNRYSENKLLAAETANFLATLHGQPYEDEQLRESWRTVLFNQFHDIFDGCAIHETYDLATVQHNEIQAGADKLTYDSLSSISAGVQCTGEGLPFAVWNLLAFKRSDIVEMPLPSSFSDCRIVDSTGAEVPSQIMDGKAYFVANDIPSMGYQVYYLQRQEAKEVQPSIVESDRFYSLESDYYTIDVEKRSGCILNLYDKNAQRKIVDLKDWIEVKCNYNNLFKVDYEIPHGMSAWVIGPISRTDYLLRDAQVSVKADGPVFQILHIRHEINHSIIEQDMVVYKSLKKIDFKNRVDWQEVSDNESDAPTLRVSFTPELAKNATATYEIPFGNIERASNGNEYPSQKWIDLSDDEYGFSLLNDSKYGFSAQGNTLTMTCIRTSYAPDPIPDRGEHEFKYALYPHQGNWQQAETTEQGLAYNQPLIPIFIEGDGQGTLSLQERNSWLSVEGEGVILSGFKKAMADESLVIRLYNTRAESSDFRIDFNFEFKKIIEVSLSEDVLYGMPEFKGSRLTDNIKPYEIKTYKISLK